MFTTGEAIFQAGKVLKNVHNLCETLCFVKWVCFPGFKKKHPGDCSPGC